MRLLLAALAVGIILALLSGSCVADTRAIDLLQGDLETRSEIAIIAIDEKSLEILGPYPWNRSVHAQLLDSLTLLEPKIVAFDIGFFGEAIGTNELESAIARAQAADIRVMSTQEILDADIFEPAFPIESGYSNLFLDPDGIVRRMPLHLEDREPFALLVARAIQPTPIPDEDTLLIRYFGEPGSITRYSYADVLSHDIVPSQPVLFVGVTAAALHDDYLTPVSNGVAMPGVEVHANIYEMFMSKAYLRVIPNQEVFVIIMALLGGMCIWLAFVYLQRPYWVLLGLTIPALHLIAVVHLFSKGLILWPITHLVSFFAGAGAAAGMWVVLEQKEKRHLRGAFEKYVSPALIRDLLRDPSKLSLGGARRELSILFSDIRGFTSLSEQLEAEELVSLLNDYLTAMTQTILEHGGTVDKYIGDAIMAFWNAPVDQENHAVRACTTALAMSQQLQVLKKQDRFKKLNVGIGIHTGEVVVGNMGSHDRFDYTAIGDNVNLSSRLEGLTKQYKVEILVSEATKNSAGNAFSYRRLDMVRVKGKKKPIGIYELVFERTKTHDLFEEALNEYFSGKFVRAKKLFKQAGDAQSKIFLDRIAILTKEKKKDYGSWDGVWTHETK